MMTNFAYLLAFVCSVAGILDLRQDQSAKTPLAFEVVSIKPYNPDPPRQFVQAQYLPSGFHAEGALLRGLIMQAYQVRVEEIGGEPAWADNDRYEVTAKAERPCTRAEIREMLRTMLANRFQLRFHLERKPATVLTLMVAKPGKIERSFNPSGTGTIRSISPLKFQAKNTSMPELSQFIGNWIDRRVIDKTGLDGFYDFALAFIPPEGMYGLPPGVEKPDYPDIFGAVKEQLGLKLESQKGEIEMLVIDRVQKPSEN